jgi:hypothetical protein
VTAVRGRALAVACAAPALLLALLAPAARRAVAAPGPQGPGVRIAASWDEGLAEAARRNVPIFVVLQKDGAAPFAQTFQQPAFAQFLNDRCVVLVGHRPNGHQPAKRVEGRGADRHEVEYCPVYLTIPCAVHDAIYNDYAGRFDYKDLPAAFICRPDGHVMFDKVEAMGPPAIQQKVAEAQATLGEGVFGSELDRLEHKLGKGDEKLAQGHLQSARKVYEDEREAARKPLLQQLCDERLTRLDARAVELIDEAKAKNGKERTDELHRIEREMRGRAPAEAALKALQELEAGGS